MTNEVFITEADFRLAAKLAGLVMNALHVRDTYKHWAFRQALAAIGSSVYNDAEWLKLTIDDLADLKRKLDILADTDRFDAWYEQTLDSWLERALAAKLKANLVPALNAVEEESDNGSAEALVEPTETINTGIQEEPARADAPRRKKGKRTTGK